MRRSILCIFLLIFSFPAFAGNMGSSNQASHFKSEQIVSFAKKVEQTLAKSGARVAIVSRVGRPSRDLPSGVRYTHVAFWVYSNIKTSDGRTVPGYQVYNLYQSHSQRNRSTLVRDFPVDFFAGVHNLRAGVIIPKPRVQKAILNAISSGTYRKLHNPKYSVLSNPFNSQYQNCTEHVLDVVMAAVHKTSNINQIKAKTQATFRPQPIRLDPLQASLGPVFSRGFTRRDHEGAIKTATFTTIGSFMKRNGLVQRQFSIN